MFEAFEDYYRDYYPKEELDYEEFKDVYSTEQLQQAIAEVDVNGDGEIDF